VPGRSTSAEREAAVAGTVTCPAGETVRIGPPQRSGIRAAVFADRVDAPARASRAQTGTTGPYERGRRICRDACR